MRVHYPRTPHLPWSPGATADDVRARDMSGFRGREVVVTEKLDGENTTLYADGLHARSLDSAHHPSRTWVKALQSRVGSRIPAGWRVCGENLFARHSIGYSELLGYFYGFSVWDGERCLPWDRTDRFLRDLGIPTAPVLWRGIYDERAIRALKFDTERQEGYVVRTVDGFEREAFGEQVAKWVRPSHVQTTTHWMHASVVENGLGASSALWSTRSGGEVEAGALLAAVGFDEGAEPEDRVVARALAELDVVGRTGDARLAGALAAALHSEHRGTLMPRLVAPLGMPLARRVADLVGLSLRLSQPYPDEERRTGLVRMSFAADLQVLHAVASAVADSASNQDSDSGSARDLVAWSALHAEEAGLFENPLRALRSGLRDELSEFAPEVADRCWAQSRESFADGRIASVSAAVAATWRWRSGEFPRLLHMVGPSGSGKSVFAERFARENSATLISLDDLREEYGSRADQRSNDQVLTTAIDRLDEVLAAGQTAVWDATSLIRRQRSLVHGIARRRDALTTHAVVLVAEDELVRRNKTRDHPVPPEVLQAQLRRFTPPYPGEAHRTWYVGPGGVADVDGSLNGEDD